MISFPGVFICVVMLVSFSPKCGLGNNWKVLAGMLQGQALPVERLSWMIHELLFMDKFEM